MTARLAAVIGVAWVAVAVVVAALAGAVIEHRRRYWLGELHRQIVRAYRIRRDAEQHGVTLDPGHAAALREAEITLLDHQADR